MASTSKPKRIKRVARKTRPTSPNGWISDEEAQTNFINFWRSRKIIPHKYLNLNFFRREAFIFHDNVNFSDEAFLYYNKKNMVDKTALHRMALRSIKNGWAFKDEIQNEAKEVDRATTVANLDPRMSLKNIWENNETKGDAAINDDSGSGEEENGNEDQEGDAMEEDGEGEEEHKRNTIT
ncbi:hypothetical protein LR48_Vigan07g184300 [Vigna angularis]|uniref:Uncharacterized protein n=1 Tax=Phaseolus angularis TaxID=3914 RepID=A0A0L9V030_PHAAN|nr:hypothetical protein LR48_Vigan07g184300 [Vigna angularis]